MNQRRKKLDQFATASPIPAKGQHDIRRHPVLIVSSRNANFIRRLRSEFEEQGIPSDLQIADDEASIYALPQHSGRAFVVLPQVQELFSNWRGKKSKSRKQLKISQVCITLGLVLFAIVQPIVPHLFQTSPARSPLHGVAILASWLALLFIFEHFYQKKKWEGVVTFSVREMLFGSTLFAIVLVLWRFAATI